MTRELILIYRVLLTVFVALECGCDIFTVEKPHSSSSVESGSRSYPGGDSLSVRLVGNWAIDGENPERQVDRFAAGYHEISKNGDHWLTERMHFISEDTIVIGEGAGQAECKIAIENDNLTAVCKTRDVETTRTFHRVKYSNVP